MVVVGISGEEEKFFFMYFSTLKNNEAKLTILDI